MRPVALQSKIFLDSADPIETEQTLIKIGFLDGQTTNPTLLSKNPVIQQYLNEGKKYKREQLLEQYKNIVQSIKNIIPQGQISIEVYADSTTKASEMIEQAEEMDSWVENAYIKLPITREGLKAANNITKKGINVNMTLCFTQEQAAAVYSATIDAQADVLISPFQGRLDDNCKDGTDLIMNIQRMYAHSDKHVKVVTSSIRDYKHFLYALFTRTDYVTVPYKVLEEWSNHNMQLPGVDISEDLFEDKVNYFKDINDSCIVGISYKEIPLNLEWSEYNISNELTDQGVTNFANDWNNLVKN